MKHVLRLLILVFVVSTTSTLELAAQNPAQSKKYKKKAQQAKKQKKDPYTAVYHDADSDHDGVPDTRDQCIHTPKGEPVTPFGCPYDVDFDGIFDYQDSCKNEAGPKENHGCPWGDKDGDGILDNVDNCPTVFGLKLYKGCPDTDGDGIPDNEDKCPKQPGVVKYAGCPPPFNDMDGDGVSDYEDLCPTTPGLKTNRGCPELKPAEKALLQKAFDNLLFESGSDVIVSSSFSSLNDLATVLSNNPSYKLYLEGHTDNVGDDEANLDLSKRRAISVKNYLITKGVSADRLSTDGFGETRPVDSNDIPEGRTKNRRVEMHIIQ
jgi:OOP family OmpA-OmpF porin